MRSCLIDIGNGHCPGLLMKPAEQREKERETLDITGGEVWARGEQGSFAASVPPGSECIL